VHGRSDLLQSLLDFIRSDAEKRKQEPKVIFLGDIVDRGPDSKGCIELVISTLNDWPTSKLILGNHDDWFVRVLGTDVANPSAVQAWIRNGGLPTLYGYDYEPDLRMARQAIKLDYEHHISLFQQASIIEIDGAFAFVHAGIHPHRPIEEQDRADCLSIRKPFLEHTAPFSHIVVHGHTITESNRPVVARNRIAIDTGAYATGHLTTLIIDPQAKAIEFASTIQTESNIEVQFLEPVWSGTPDVLSEYFDITCANA
jgi:serine/threonine protein phosphatase 1